MRNKKYLEETVKGETKEDHTDGIRTSRGSREQSGNQGGQGKQERPNGGM